MNSVNVNLQNLFSNFANLHNFSMTDVSDFGIEYVKFDTLFYFALIDANALTQPLLQACSSDFE